MSQIQKVEQARQEFSRALTDAGLSDDEPTCESMLIRDGFYVGRRFRSGAMEGVWLVESGELTLHMHEQTGLAEDDVESHCELKKAA